MGTTINLLGPPRRQRCRVKCVKTNRLHISMTLLLVLLVAKTESRSPFGKQMLTAAIFGSNRNEETKREEPPKPPPTKIGPPPPPGQPPIKTSAGDNGVQNTPPVPPPPPPRIREKDHTSKHANSNEAPPPPTTMEGKEDVWIHGGANAAANQWPPQQWWDVSQYGQQSQQSQQQQYPYYPEQNRFDPQMNGWNSMEQQFQDALAREQELYGQIQNLTASISAMEQQDQLHVRQMDVLTERIMDSENQVAKERNQALEYKSNCTELGREISALRKDLEDWQARCAEFADKQQLNENKIKELKRNLKAARAEAENLAISIENARIRDQMGEGSNKKKKKSRGLLGWLFSFLVSSEPEIEEDDPDPEELAKSTLLRALQSERNSVDELEASIASLQQNNSAIAEMVKSRDLIIDELNDRVAVFEEDKVVLKAALRQLQKEMKEEAPKTQQLIDDLDKASQEVDHLNTEIESLVQTHQDEIASLRNSIAQKESTINATESNLTVIGKYVDKLEERLASFAITRRDIEAREQKCKEIETTAKQAKQERDSLQSKITEYEQEQSELKNLLDELVQERTSLRQENERLVEERDSLLQGAERSRKTLASLENSIERLRNEAEEWRNLTKSLEKDLNSTKSSTAGIQDTVEAFRAENEDLRKKFDESKKLNEELKVNLALKQNEIENSQQAYESKSLELAQKQRSLEEKVAALLESEGKFMETSTRLQRVEGDLKAKSAELNRLRGSSKGTGSSAPGDPKIFSQPQKSMGNQVVEEGLNITKTEEQTDRNRTVAPSLPKEIGKLEPKSVQKPASKQRSGEWKMPFRGIRKFFAKTTGIHGAFSRKSKISASYNVLPSKTMPGLPKSPSKIGFQQTPPRAVFSKPGPSKYALPKSPGKPGPENQMPLKSQAKIGPDPPSKDNLVEPVKAKAEPKLPPLYSNSEK